jgi:hypothetical protein
MGFGRRGILCRYRHGCAICGANVVRARWRKFHADAEEVLAKLPGRGIPMVLRELRDGNAKPFAFSTMQHIVQRMRKATGEVDYVEALAH